MSDMRHNLLLLCAAALISAGRCGNAAIEELWRNNSLMWNATRNRKTTMFFK